MSQTPADEPDPCMTPRPRTGDVVGGRGTRWRPTRWRGWCSSSSPSRCSTSSSDFLTAVLVAFLISAIASIFLLRNQRAALSTSIATRAERANQKMAERAAVEDDWDDVQRGDAEGSDSRS